MALASEVMQRLQSLEPRTPDVRLDVHCRLKRPPFENTAARAGSAPAVGATSPRARAIKASNGTTRRMARILRVVRDVYALR
jgi:hypothetical protein